MEPNVNQNETMTLDEIISKAEDDISKIKDVEVRNDLLKKLELVSRCKDRKQSWNVKSYTGQPLGKDVPGVYSFNETISKEGNNYGKRIDFSLCFLNDKVTSFDFSIRGQSAQYNEKYDKYVQLKQSPDAKKHKKEIAQLEEELFSKKALLNNEGPSCKSTIVTFADAGGVVVINVEQDRKYIEKAITDDKHPVLVCEQMDKSQMIATDTKYNNVIVKESMSSKQGHVSQKQERSLEKSEDGKLKYHAIRTSSEFESEKVEEEVEKEGMWPKEYDGQLDMGMKSLCSVHRKNTGR